MISSERQSVHPDAQSDASAAGDWLRLGVMLLLLAVGRSVAPMQPKHLTNTAPDAPTTPIASFILARTSR